MGQGASVGKDTKKQVARESALARDANLRRSSQEASSKTAPLLTSHKDDNGRRSAVCETAAAAAAEQHENSLAERPDQSNSEPLGISVSSPESLGPGSPARYSLDRRPTLWKQQSEMHEHLSPPR